MSKPITLKMIAAHDLPRTYVPGTDALDPTVRADLMTEAAAILASYRSLREDLVAKGVATEKRVGGHPEVVAYRNAACAVLVDTLLIAIQHRDNALWGDLLMIGAEYQVLPKFMNALRNLPRSTFHLPRARNLVQAMLEGDAKDAEVWTDNAFISFEEGKGPILDTDAVLSRSHQIKNEARARYAAHMAAAAAAGEVSEKTTQAPAPAEPVDQVVYTAKAEGATPTLGNSAKVVKKASPKAKAAAK